MNKNKEYISNTLILLLGKFTTQFMSLLLLPLYTNYLLTDDFGIVDLLQTYITLFVPVLIFRIDSAVFRFLLDSRKNENHKKDIITNVFFILLIGLTITFVFGLIVGFVFEIKYYSFVFFNIIVLMISSTLLQVLRGIGKNLNYSIASIISGLITLISNIILIVCFKWNASSILISSIVANLICIAYIVFSSKLYKYIDFKAYNKNVVKEILYYSLPMIPNALSWWIVNVSDRTIITTFLGSALNGIYSVSCKFSNIINSIFSIFNMSWQESASLHINDKDRDEFFTDMINKLYFVFASCSLFIVGILPFVFDIIIGNDYLLSYKYIPIILYANTWNIFISLIGAIYVAKKKTKEIANTTIISSIINIVINLCFIKQIGLYAACFSTVIAYMVMGIYRYMDVKKYVNLKLDLKGLIIFSVVFIISSFMYLSNYLIIFLINLLIIIIYCILTNKNLIKYVVIIIKRRLNSNK